MDEPSTTEDRVAALALYQLRRHTARTDLALARILAHLGLAEPTDAEVDAALTSSLTRPDGRHAGQTANPAAGEPGATLGP